MASRPDSSSVKSRQSSTIDQSAPPTAARQTTSDSAHRSPERRQSGDVSPVSAVSPHTSRNASPVRAERKTGNATSAESSSQSGESTHTSTQSASSITSPVQGPTQVPPPPSAAAVQRALSLTGVDGRSQLPQAEAVNKQTKNVQDGVAGDGNALHWPKSPRLKPPNPPGGSSSAPRRTSAPTTKSGDGEVVDGINTAALATQDGVQQSEQTSKSPTAGSTQAASAAAKIPRGFSGLTPTLETVQEGDLGSSPNDPSTGKTGQATSPDKQRADIPPQRNVQEPRPIQNTIREGSIDKGLEKKDEPSKVPDTATESAQKPPPPTQRKSFTSLAPQKVRQANDGSSNHMTVEMETVDLAPHTTSSNNPADRVAATKKEDSGSVKMKSSNETIRPRKDKKKNAKKPNSIMSGTGSSKADIFEAKVTSAVDEDDYDSDETFVYESNPPEPRSRPRRHHSRTPSSTSIQSLGDRRGGVRPLNSSNDQQKGGVKPKRSMKFASNAHAHSSMDEESGDVESRRTRSSNHRPNTPGDPRYQHLYGRRGDHHSPGDPESPYSQAAKAHHHNSAPNSRQVSRPNSPRSRSPTHLQVPNGNKGSPPPYDFDPEREGNERTPLVDTVRSPRRYGAGGLPSSNLRHITYYEETPRGWLRRCAGCIVLSVVLILLIMGAAGFLFATTKALFNVHILAIENVLASEQEIMLDLLVEATNPNIVAVSVSNMDVNIFAKSRYVGTGSLSHPQTGSPHSDGRVSRGPSQRTALTQTTPPHTQDKVDHGTDPIDDPEGDPQTMLLGRIFHFDTALTFAGSPIRRLPANSTGELRLEQPGNKTEAGGSERWERVIQHPFELIVRGILKYQLPLSSRTMTASVGARIEIDPDEEDDLERLRGVGRRALDW